VYTARKDKEVELRAGLMKAICDAIAQKGM
jgi:hypothetical protein